MLAPPPAAALPPLKIDVMARWGSRTDPAMYTPEASATIAVLADQFASAAYLPALAVMTVVGVAAVRDRVLPVGVGAVTLLLAAATLAATLVLGLPYSSSLVYPLFALVVGAAGLLSRWPA